MLYIDIGGDIGAEENNEWLKSEDDPKPKGKYALKHQRQLTTSYSLFLQLQIRMPNIPTPNVTHACRCHSQPPAILPYLVT